MEIVAYYPDGPGPPSTALPVEVTTHELTKIFVNLKAKCHLFNE